MQVYSHRKVIFLPYNSVLCKAHLFQLLFAGHIGSHLIGDPPHAPLSPFEVCFWAVLFIGVDTTIKKIVFTMREIE